MACDASVKAIGLDSMIISNGLSPLRPGLKQLAGSWYIHCQHRACTETFLVLYITQLGEDMSNANSGYG